MSVKKISKKIPKKKSPAAQSQSAFKSIPPPSKQEGVELTISKKQLEHLRDLMSVTLGEGGTFISQMLAVKTMAKSDEHNLWELISGACMREEVQIGADAPDICLMPQIDIDFKLNVK